MTKGQETTSKPWAVKGTSRKDKLPQKTKQKVAEDSKTEEHAMYLVEVACKRLYGHINSHFRRGMRQYTRDHKFIQAKLYEIICDQARRTWSSSAVRMVQLNYKHDVFSSGPKGPIENGPSMSIMMTWPWCKIAMEVRRINEKYHHSYQTVRSCFARMAYLVSMVGCQVGLVAVFGTKEDFQKADLDLYCTPLGGESVVDSILSKDVMSMFGYEDMKGLEEVHIPWAYQRDLKVNCIMDRFKPSEGLCVRLYRVHPSKTGRFDEKWTDKDRLFVEYAQYEVIQHVLEGKGDSAEKEDIDKFFSAENARKEIDKIDVYLQCGAWTKHRANAEYKKMLERVKLPDPVEGDVIMSEKVKIPGQVSEFKYLSERLQDRIKYTHCEVISYKYLPPKEDVAMVLDPKNHWMKFMIPEPMPDEDVKPVNSYPASLTLPEVFTEALHDQTSTEFQQLSSETKAMIEEALSKELGDIFHSVQITGFKEGSVVAEFLVVLSVELDETIQERIENILQKLPPVPDDSTDNSEPEMETDEEELEISVQLPILLNTKSARRSTLPKVKQAHVAVERIPSAKRRSLPAAEVGDVDPATRLPGKDLAFVVEQTKPIILNTKGPRPSRGSIKKPVQSGPFERDITFGKEYKIPITRNEKGKIQNAETRSLLKDLAFGESHVVPIVLNTKPTKMKPMVKKSNPDARSVYSDAQFGEEHTESITWKKKLEKRWSNKDTSLAKK